MSFRIKTRIKGARKAQAEIRRIRKRMPEAFNAALYAEAVRLYKASQGEVPVRTGRLKNSGAVGPFGSVLNFSAIVSYGEGDALPVHERIEVRHATGKARFLEDPYNRLRTGMPRRVADNTLRFFKRGRAPRPIAIGNSRTNPSR